MGSNRDTCVSNVYNHGTRGIRNISLHKDIKIQLYGETEGIESYYNLKSDISHVSGSKNLVCSIFLSRCIRVTLPKSLLPSRLQTGTLIRSQTMFFSLPKLFPNFRRRSTEFTPFPDFPIKHFHRGFATRLGLTALICRYLTVRRLSVTAGHRGGIVEVAWPRGRAARVAEYKESERAPSFSRRGRVVGGSVSPIVARMESARGVVLSSVVVSVPEPRGRKREGAADDDGVDSDTGDSDGDRSGVVVAAVVDARKRRW